MPKEPHYPALPANPNIPVQVSEIPLIAIPYPGADPILFYEYWMPKDGDCGYHTLGISRSFAAKQLYDSANREDIRALLAPEIEAALLDNDLPDSMKKISALQALFSKRLRSIEAQKTLDEALATIKSTFGTVENRFFSGMDAETLSMKIEGEPKQILLQLISNIQCLKKSIQEFCCQPITFISYVQHCIAQPGYFLTFLGQIGEVSQSTSLDAIAKLNHLSIQVWTKVGTTLKLLHHYYPEHSTHVVHLHYIPGHFNLLSTNKALSIYPVATQGWERAQSSLKLPIEPSLNSTSEKLKYSHEIYEKSMNSIRLLPKIQVSKNNILFSVVKKIYQHTPYFLSKMIENIHDILEGLKEFYKNKDTLSLDEIQTSIIANQLVKLRMSQEKSTTSNRNKTSISYLIKHEIELSIFIKIMEDLFPVVFQLADLYFKQYPNETIESFQGKIIKRLKKIISTLTSESSELPTIIVEVKYRRILISGIEHDCVCLWLLEKNVHGYLELLYEYYQSFNPEIPTKVKFSGFDNCTLQVDQLGNLEVMELETEGNFICNVEKNLTLSGQGIIEGDLILYTPGQIVNIGNYQSKGFIHVHGGKVTNRGLFTSKTFKTEPHLHITEPMIFDNHGGHLVSRSNMVLKGHNLNNDKGIISTIYLSIDLTGSLSNRLGKIYSNHGGTIQVLEKINNQQGKLEIDTQSLSIKCLDGELKCSNQGYIRAWRGGIQVVALTIETDESSIIHGDHETTLSGKNLKLNSIVSGTEVNLKSINNMEITQGALGYNNLSIIFEKQRLNLKKPVVAKRLVSIRASDIIIMDHLKAIDIQLWIKNQLQYSRDSFITSGTLSIHSENTLRIPMPFVIEGSLNLHFSETATQPFNIIHNIATNAAGTGLNGNLSLHAPKTPVTIGNTANPYLKLLAREAINFKVGSFHLIHGKIIGQQKLSIISDTFIKVGESEPQHVPCGLISAGAVCLEAQNKIDIEASDIYGDESLLMRSPTSIISTSNNMHTLGNAIIESPIFNHQVLTKTTPGGNTVACTHPNTHCAYKTMGSKFEVLSKPSVLCVGKVLKITGKTNILGSQIQHNGFEGAAPTITTLTPHEFWTLSVLGGHRKLKHAWWSHVDNRTYGTPIPAIFSSSTDLVLKNTHIDIFGFVVAHNIKMHQFHVGKIGLTCHNILLPNAKPFKQTISLMDHLRQNARYELINQPNLIEYRSVLPNSFRFSLPPLTVLNSNGKLTKQPPGVTQLMPSDMEAELLIHSLMAELRRGFLELKGASTHTIFYHLVKHAYEFMQENQKIYEDDSSYDSSWILKLNKPMLVYKVQTFDKLPKLVPYLILPLIYDNPRMRDWIGGLYSSHHIDIEGIDKETSTLHITAHLDANKLIRYSHLKTLLHEKNTYRVQHLVENTEIIKKNFGLNRKSVRSTQIVEQQIPQAGNTIIAEGVEFSNVDQLILKGATIQTGSRGIIGTQLGDIHEMPTMSSSIKMYHSSGNIRHYVKHVPYSSRICSNGSISLSSESASYYSVAISSKHSIHVSTLYNLNFLSTSTPQELPSIQIIKKRKKRQQWDQIEKSTRVSLSSEAGDIHCSSTQGAIECVGTEMAARNIHLSSNQNITIRPLMLNYSRHTIISNRSWLTKSKKIIHERHQHGLLPILAAQQSIHLTSHKKNILLVASFMYAGEGIQINSPMGKLIVKSITFQHNLTYTQKTHSLHFFGSQTIQALIKKDFKQAISILEEEFPTLNSIRQLARSKDMADILGNGLKSLYCFSKLISQFYSAQSFLEFLNSQLSIQVGMNLHLETSDAMWTELALPWLYARNIILKANKIQMESIQLEADTFEGEASIVNFSSAFKKMEILKTGNTVSTCLNLRNLIPTVSINLEKEETKALYHMSSYLNIAKMLKINAGDTLSLKGVYIKAQEVFLNANYIHLETLQNSFLYRRNSSFVSSAMAWSTEQQAQSRVWSDEQTTIEADKSLSISANRQLTLIGAHLALTVPNNRGERIDSMSYPFTSQPSIIRAPVLIYRDLLDHDKRTHFGMSQEVGGLCFDTHDGFKGSLDMEHRKHVREQQTRATVGQLINMVTGTSTQSLNRNSTMAQTSIRNSTQHQRIFTPLGSARDLKVGFQTLKQSPVMLKEGLKRHFKKQTSLTSTSGSVGKGS